MTQHQILNWISVIAITFALVSIPATLLYLRHVREKVRRHRDVRRMVTEAGPKNLELFDHLRTKTR